MLNLGPILQYLNPPQNIDLLDDKPLVENTGKEEEEVVCSYFHCALII
jgi:hypothetical protein